MDWGGSSNLNIPKPDREFILGKMAISLSNIAKMIKPVDWAESISPIPIRSHVTHT